MQIDTTAIQRFLDLIKRSSKSRSREVRIDMTDATILTTEIGMVLSRLAMLENSKAVAQPSVSGSLDGGSLR